MNPRLKGIPTYPQVRLDAAKERARAAGKTLHDFGTGDPLEPTPPFIRDAVRAAISEISQYPSAFGSAELREAAAAYLERVFGVQVDPDREVLATSGSKEAIFHFPLALLDPNGHRRGVIFGEPGYPVYASGAILAGGVPVAIPLVRESGYLLEPETLDRQVIEGARILWLNYPHNPTGTVAPRWYVDRIVRFARAHDLVVCADECYAEFGGTERATSVLEIEREGVLAFHSLSKRSGMTGYRSGFVAGDPALIAAYRRVRPLIGTGSPDFVQRAAALAWADDAHVAERRRAFEAKRAVLRSFFDSAGLRTSGEGALYLWVEVPAGRTSEAWAESLVEVGIVVAPGSYFGASGEGYVRVALVPTVAECHAAVRAWRAALPGGAVQ